MKAGIDSSRPSKPRVPRSNRGGRATQSRKSSQQFPKGKPLSVILALGPAYGLRKWVADAIGAIASSKGGQS